MEKHVDGVQEGPHRRRKSSVAPTVTPYATASWASVGTWAWMNPLVLRGRRAALQPSDVPALLPSHRAERFAARRPCSSSGSGGGNNRDNFVRRTLLRCFWPHLLLNAALALARAAASFVGPLLIRSFVAYASAPGPRPPLVLALLAAKAAEALLSNQYTFQCGNLGMQIRGSLLAALYGKALRLSCSELDDGAVARTTTGNSAAEPSVRVTDGVFAWDDHGRKEEVGELVAVVGTVGSGKSSLLGCVLGEMRKVSGTVTVRGTTAYVAQTAWIQSGTIMDDILFGRAMDRERYREVIRVCCLEEDLAAMDLDDMTEIGELGFTLSGGQRQRIQLARAVYQDCDVYLLDDVFSAVDAHTGVEIFKAHFYILWK